ncbi:MAG: hypothetical protein DDT26_00047 [Dehalococcoidia bacterium]|nr:hypothetical protein [Chloroflexota bacterium]
MKNNLSARAELRVLRDSWRQIALTAAALLGVYLLTLTIKPGFLTYVLSLPPLLIIVITALARVNDIRPEQASKRWHVRRAGLVLMGFGSVWLMGSAFVGDHPEWKDVLLYWGLALTWLTTPSMPPWWKYVSRDDERRGPNDP